MVTLAMVLGLFTGAIACVFMLGVAEGERRERLRRRPSDRRLVWDVAAQRFVASDRRAA